jgi:hypothetical protein
VCKRPVRTSSAGQVEFLILARRDDATLVPAQHPVAADLRVEVDVDLVGVKYRLLGARAGFELANRSQNTQPSVTWPRTQDDGLGRTEPRADPRQRPAHRAHGDGREAFELHLQAEQLTGPGRPLPSEVLRRAAQQAHQHAVEPLVGLARAVVAAPVVQPGNAIGEEPVGGTDHRRGGDLQRGRNLPRAAAGPQPGNGLKSQRGVGVVAAASQPDQLPSLDATHSRYLHRTGLLGVWVSGDSQTSGLPRPFPSAPTFDRQSRSVI